MKNDFFKHILLSGGSKQNRAEIENAELPVTFSGNGHRLRNYRIYGNSVERKNLLKNTAVSQTVNGVTFTVNEDGSVTANGTATATVNFYLNRNLTIPEGDYIVSLTTVGAYSNSSIPLIILQSFGDYTYAVVNTTTQLTVTSNPGSAVIQIPSASEVDCTFYPMIRKANIEDSTYEPYIENTSVGDLQANGKYLVPVTVSGKNLLKNTATSQTINGVTFTVNDDGSVTCNGTAVGIYNTFFIPFKASGGTYILNGCPKSGSDNSYRLDIRDSSGSVIAFDYGEGTGGVQLGDSAAYRITIRLQQNYICDNLTFYPMIRPADITATDYEPYHEPQTVNIELDAPLRKVGNETDYIDFREQKQHRVRKNILQNTATTQTINGVTFTVNDDGSIDCTRTNTQATGVSVFTINSEELSFTEDYILTGCPAGGSNGSYFMRYIYDIDTGTSQQAFDYGSGVAIPKNKSGDIQIRFASGYNFDGTLTFRPMIRKADITDDAYEPYIENTEIDVTLPALPILEGTNTLSIGTTVQPSKIWIQGNISEIETVSVQALQANMQSLQPLSLDDENLELDVMPIDKSEIQTDYISETPVENTDESEQEENIIENTGDDENAE